MDGVEEQVSITVDDYEITSSSDSEIKPSNHNCYERLFNNFTMNGMLRLRNDSSEYNKIRKSFTAGMAAGMEVNGVVIHRNSYSNPIGQAKMVVFRIFSKAVAEKRGGDANVKCAWYGGSRDEISGIIAYGFSGNFGDGYGNGIVLSPANFPIDSAWRAVEDENGVRHMLLCRVALGNTELVSPGSDQIQPSSTDFDSGIDNPLAPRKYLVWRAYMNSFIFPNYIISFRTSSTPGSNGIGISAVKPNSPRIMLPVLLKGLSEFLQPSQMGLALKYYHDFL
ncbi:hypothetical protein RD792_004619, partial [Penstemon davidsonii]